MILSLFSWFIVFSEIWGVIGNSNGLSLMPRVSLKEVSVGENVAITCFGNRNNVKYLSWWKEHQDQPIKTGNSGEKMRVYAMPYTTHATGLVLLLNDIKLTDVGMYICRNESSRTDVSFRLVLQESIEFLDTPFEQTGEEGQEMLIRCEAKGDPEPTIKWIGPHNRPLLPEKFQVVGDGLVISNLSKSDAGEYTCMAFQDAAGALQSASIQVRVKYEPVWIEEDGRDVVYKSAASTAVLSCDAKAYPPPTFTWYLDGVQISNETSSLAVNKTGNYQCLVCNDLGAIRRNFIVKEGKLPGRPVDVKPRNVTRNSFSVDVLPPKDTHIHNIKGYHIELFSDKGERRHINISSANPSVLITDLNPGTQYTIRVRAENEVGLGDYSLEVEAITSKAVKCFFCYSSLLLTFSVKLLSTKI